MRKIIALLLLATATPALADEPATTASPVQQTKQAVREGAHAIGQGTRKVTTAIGHGVRDTAKAIGHGTRDTAHEVGHATKGAVQEVTGK